MPVWKGQLGYLICNKLESTIHQITTLAILTMLAVWVTLVALVSVLSCSVNSCWLLPGPSRRQAPVIKCNAFLCFQSYIVRDISLTEIYRWLVTFIEILSAILKSTSGGVKRKIIAFWTTRFPAFMSKNLRVNIWRDKFTSDRLRVNLPLWNVTRK